MTKNEYRAPQINPHTKDFGVGVYFYLPFRTNIQLPTTISDYWRWQIAAEGLSKSWGIYHWVLQTHLHLKAAGIPCQLTQSIPQEGILITHHHVLIPTKIKPNKKLIIVDILVDKDITRYRFANFYIVHNPNQTSFSNRNVYIPPWPQVSLIPRSKERGDIFENIAYVGTPEQLAGELHSEGFRNRLQDMGLHWTIVERKQWNDFSKLDAVIAVRSFDGNSRYQHKSSLKLVNAWFAGVPAILGPEPAFRAVGKSSNDYLEVASVEDIVKALLLLKKNVALRKKLVENGRQKAIEFSEEKILAYWQDFLFSRLIPYYHQFNRNVFKRIAFFLEKKPGNEIGETKNYPL